MQKEKLGLYLFLGLLLAAVVASGALFFPYVDIIVVAATLAVVIEPVYSRLLKYVKFPGLAAFICSLAAFVVILIPITLLGYQILQESKNLYALLGDSSALASLQDAVSAKMRGVVPAAFSDAFPLDIKMYLKAVIDWVSSKTGALFSNIIQITFSGFIAFIALYYLLKDGKEFRSQLAEHLPLPKASTERIFQKLQATASSIIKGSLVVAIVQGVLSGVGFMIFGVPHAAFWGLLCIFASLFPTIGTALVLVPAVAYLGFFASALAAAGLLAWGVVIVGLSDNLLRPYLLKRDVEIHPFLIFLSVFGGLAIFGPTGFILGPLIVSLLIALLELYPEFVGEKNS